MEILLGFDYSNFLKNCKRAASIALLILLFASCAQMRYFPLGNVQTGLASWYGTDFHGKKTSSSEIFNMHDMTAAHKTLPFGTYVMVTNLNNGKSVMVRINDRGPFIRGRIIDISYAAAKVIDMVGSGVAPVRIEVVREFSPPKLKQQYSVQVGAFIYKENAKALHRKLRNKFKNVHILTFSTSNQVYYRVRIRAKNASSANKIAQQLISEGYNVFIVEEN
ncbi:MAG: septal ring lytic transglycosylase RlpA family protein [Candidatus Aminicenantaceae bacterium]